MILSYNDIMNMGFRIGTDVKQATVELAIEAAELYYVAPSMKAEDWITLENTPSTDVLIKGGVYTHDGHSERVAGLKKGIAYIAYAELLRMNINATTFGSVQKNDDYSTNVNPAEQIKYFISVGLRYVRQICDIKGFHVNAQTGVARESYYTGRKEKGVWQQ